MADLRAEVWSRPGAATFEKIWEDPQAVRFGGTVRVSGTGDGEMTLPDTADTHELADLLLLTDPDTPANSTRALIRVFKDGDIAGTDDPLHEWRVSSVVPPTDETDPVWEGTGLDPFDFLNDAEVKAWDWDGTNDFTSLFPDWIFGGRNLLKDIESQFRPHTVEVYTTVQVDETQSIYNDATGGNFTLSFDGQGPTGDINWNAGANTIKTELELLSNITEVTVTGTHEAADPWLVTFNDPGSTDVAMITANDAGLTGETIGTTIAEVLKGNTGGTFTIGVDLDGGGVQTTAAIAYDATPVQVDAALTLLGYVTDVAVAGEGTETRPYRIQFVSPATSATGSYVITVNGAGLDNGGAFVVVAETGVLVPKGWEESKSYVSTLNHGVNTAYRLSDGTGADPALPACDSSGWSILFNGTEPYYPGIQKPVKVKPGGIYQGSVWAYAQGAGAEIALVVRDLYENLFGFTRVTLVANTWTEISLANVAIPATTSEVLFRVGHTGTGDPPPVFISCPQFLEGLPAATIGDIWEQLYDDATTNHSGVGRICWEDESASLPDNLFLVLDFTDLVDSDGAGWVDSEVAITGKRGWSYSTFMKETVKLGYEARVVSAATDGQWKLQIYNPGTLGTNYTGDDAIGIRVGRDVIRKAVRRFLPAGTAITVEGSDQQFSLRADANAVTALGRLERYSPDRDIMTLTETGLAATAILAKALAKGLSIQPVLSVGADDPQPLVDWTAGDTLDVDDPDEGVTFTARVAALTYAVTDSVTYEPALSSESFVGTSAVSQGVRQLLEAQDAIRREPPRDAAEQIAQEAWNAGGGVPTVLVAASDAREAVKQIADYVCDGLNDQAVIELALASHSFGRLVLSEGLFNITVPNAGIGITVPNRWSVTGMGILTTYLYDAGADPGATATTLKLGIWSTIRDLTLESSGTQRHIQLANVSRVVHTQQITGNTGPMFYVSGSASDVIIRDNHLDNAGGGPLVEVQTGLRDFLFHGNFVDWPGTGLRLTGSTGRIIITGNLIPFGGDEELIYITGTQSGTGFVQIADNILLQAGESVANKPAIYLLATDAPTQYVDGSFSIQNNQIEIPSGAGIQIDGFNHVQVNGNRIETASRHGIHLIDASDCLISDNMIYGAGQETDNTYDGIFLEGDSNRNTIADNQVRDGNPTGNETRYGINISAAACDDNMVYDNDLTASAKTAAINDAGTGTLFGPQANEWNQGLTRADGAHVYWDNATGDYKLESAFAHAVYGEIYVEDNAVATTIGVASTWYQVTVFGTDGLASGTTPDHTTDDITIDEDGVYMVTVSAAILSGAGSAAAYEIEVKSNNGAIPHVNVHSNRLMTGGGGDIGSISLSGLINADATDTVELWVRNETNTVDIIFEDVTLTVVKVADMAPGS